MRRRRAAAHKTAASGTIERVGGHPNFSGVWSVMNTANWNIEPHLASAALELRPGPVVPVPAKAIVALGAVGSVPAGMGVVGRRRFPTRPRRWRSGTRIKKHYLDRDPEVKCDLPGVPRANYMPLPFQIVQSAKTMLISYEYDGRGSRHSVQRSGPGADRQLDGPVGGQMGWRYAVITVTGHKRQHVVRPRRQLSLGRYESGRTLDSDE